MLDLLIVVDVLPKLCVAYYVGQENCLDTGVDCFHKL